MNNDIPEAAAAFLDTEGFGRVIDVQTLSGGHVNRADRITTSSQASFILKQNAAKPDRLFACEADGYEAGRDGAFSQELYETCEEVDGADAYYQGFIDGCMSVEGNTRDVCESATDAD